MRMKHKKKTTFSSLAEGGFFMLVKNGWPVAVAMVWESCRKDVEREK